jgi:transcriptional regulator with XRE-family HTH domain
VHLSVRHREFIERVGLIVRTERRASTWTQRELGRRSGVPQSRISLIERGLARTVRSDEVDRLLTTLGVEFWLGARGPSHVDLRPADLVHAKCSAYVDRRLRSAGWLVAREVEVGGAQGRGWIDLLAYDPARRLLLIIEVKTELLDLGAIERTMGWYEREAVAAARRLGWRPLRSASALLVLDSDANDLAIRAARDVLARAFAGRATALRRVVSGEDAVDGARFLSSIDPRSRRSVWLRTTTTDGRRTAPPYADYADALRHLSHGPARR